MVAYGPERIRVKSSTRIPASGPESRPVSIPPHNIGTSFRK